MVRMRVQGGAGPATAPVLLHRPSATTPAALQVKGATYDSRAVRNLLCLSRRVLRAGSGLQIEVVL